MRTRVAVDVMGAAPPQGAVAAVLRALAADADLQVLLVAPPGVAPAAQRLEVVTAHDAVGTDDDAARAVRARRRASVRVAMTALRDGAVDAVVSVGPVHATIAAAGFTLGLLPGATRPLLAADVATGSGAVLLLDTSGVRGDGADLDLIAAVGGALAAALHGVPAPRIGVVVPDGADVPAGTVRVTARAVTAGAVDVVGTDGFTGSVLRDALAGPVAAPVADGAAAPAALVAGVDGVVVAADAAPDSVVAAIGLATAAVRRGAVDAVRPVLRQRLARRRELAGLR